MPRRRMRARGSVRLTGPALLHGRRVPRRRCVRRRHVQRLRNARRHLLPRLALQRGPRVRERRVSPPRRLRRRRPDVLQRNHLRARRRVRLGHVPRVDHLRRFGPDLLRGQRVQHRAALSVRPLRRSNDHLRHDGSDLLHRQHLHRQPELRRRELLGLPVTRLYLHARVGVLRRLRLSPDAHRAALLPRAGRHLRDVSGVLRRDAVHGRSLRLSDGRPGVRREPRLLRRHHLHLWHLSSRTDVSPAGRHHLCGQRGLLQQLPLRARRRRRSSLLRPRWNTVRRGRRDGRRGRS